MYELSDLLAARWGERPKTNTQVAHDVIDCSTHSVIHSFVHEFIIELITGLNWQLIHKSKQTSVQSFSLRTGPVLARTVPVLARAAPVLARTAPVLARTSPVPARTRACRQAATTKQIEKY